jgi:hypothetical protein
MKPGILTAVAAGCAFFFDDSGPLFERSGATAGQGPGSVEIADVNHDGHADILVANTSGGTLTVLLGDGRGHFHSVPGVAFPAGPSPNDLALADFNGDGHLDVAIANAETPEISILLGDGKGAFRPSPHSPFITQSYPHVHGVAAADFNGDGKVDIVTDSWGHNQILFLPGDGAGNLLTPGRPFNTGKRPYQRLRTADFNNDGQPDVVTTDLDGNGVSILLGDGKGGFGEAPGSPFPAGVFPWAVAVDDLNRDGNRDLAVLPYDRDITDQKQLGLTVLLGDGKGSFRTMPGSPFSLAGCRGPDRLASGDLNGDGFRDIAVTCAQNNKLMLFFGASGGAFRVSSIAVPTGWSGIAIADLNGDGRDDIVVSNNTGSAPGVTILLSK